MNGVHSSGGSIGSATRSGSRTRTNGKISNTRSILTMIKYGYMFNMDRDRLRDAMEDITFMLCPNDDANRDRVERGLEYDDDDSDSGSEGYPDVEELN